MSELNHKASQMQTSESEETQTKDKRVKWGGNINKNDVKKDKLSALLVLNYTK